LEPSADSGGDDAKEGPDGLPTAAESVAQAAGTFGPSDTRRIANGTDRRNAYAGSSD